MFIESVVMYLRAPQDRNVVLKIGRASDEARLIRQSVVAINISPRWGETNQYRRPVKLACSPSL